MEEDTEFLAMIEIQNTLARLDPKVAARVLRWARDKFREPIHGGGKELDKSNGVEVDVGPGDFADAAEFFHRANPTTEAEKALVVGYWLGQVEGADALDAQNINNLLKSLGHGVSNITRALKELMDRKPRLVIQVQKSGSTKQARKKYRLTDEGARAVRAMLGETVTEVATQIT